jgi:hypothetical protein
VPGFKASTAATRVERRRPRTAAPNAGCRRNRAHGGNQSYRAAKLADRPRSFALSIHHTAARGGRGLGGCISSILGGFSGSLSDCCSTRPTTTTRSCSSWERAHTSWRRSLCISCCRSVTGAKSRQWRSTSSGRASAGLGSQFGTEHRSQPMRKVALSGTGGQLGRFLRPALLNKGAAGSGSRRLVAGRRGVLIDLARAWSGRCRRSSKTTWSDCTCQATRSFTS